MTTDVAERIAAIENRITAACERSGRSRGEVTLVGAAKRQPPERILAARAAGLRHLGENLVQEAESHAALLDETTCGVSDGAAGPVVWHLIGPLQSNKARRAAARFDWIHSVDRLKIARRLDREAGRSNKRIQAFLEINLGAEPSKHGFAVEELQLPALPGELVDLEHLEIVGLMAIPPVTETAREAGRWFARLRNLRDQLFAKSSWSDRPGLLSMGMSADFEAAIEEGATHVRLGSLLFGERRAREQASLS